MNGILGFSHFLGQKNLSVAKQKQYVTIIQNSGKQLLRTIDDILEISILGTKQVKPNFEKTNLNELLFELFSIFDVKAKEKETPLYFHTGLSDEASEIYTDATKLNKILSNLLDNALKFTNEGFVEFGYQLVDLQIEIYVRDTGVVG